jgi:hypothetical protein
MKKFKKGLTQAVISIVVGLLLTALVSFLVNYKLVPDYSLTIFTIFNIISNIFTLNSMRSWGIFYTVGWLLGSLLFYYLGLMETVDFIINMVVPAAIMALRLVLWVRKTTKAYS